MGNFANDVLIRPLPIWLSVVVAAVSIHVPYTFPYLDLLARINGWYAQTALAIWVLADARRREIQLPYDYGTYLFFLGLMVAPVYLFRTRGWRAFLTLLGFVSICSLIFVTTTHACRFLFVR